MQKNPAAVALGRLGGSVRSDAKKRAAVARNKIMWAKRKAKQAESFPQATNS